MQTKIINFLKKHTVLSLATIGNNAPYAFNCFYAYDNSSQTIVFKSAKDTKHVTLLKANPSVSGTIYECNSKTFYTCGVQFFGLYKMVTDKNLATVYYAKFPFARIVPGDIYSVKLHTIKLSEMKMGMEKKLNWKASD